MLNVSKLSEELFNGYAKGIITDEECCDMIDLISNTPTTTVEEKEEDTYDWSVDNIEDDAYELEASRYDYL